LIEDNKSRLKVEVEMEMEVEINPISKHTLGAPTNSCMTMVGDSKPMFPPPVLHW
jgi:hypothetical protein